MNAPFRNPDDIAYGSEEMLLMCAAEQFRDAADEADMAARCALKGNRAGLSHHARQSAAYFQQALSLMSMLSEAGEGAR
jgi:hypothetical protein